MTYCDLCDKEIRNDECREYNFRKTFRTRVKQILLNLKHEIRYSLQYIEILPKGKYKTKMIEDRVTSIVLFICKNKRD